MSGPRLATFEAEADVDVVCKLSLTPLRVGVHGLPVVKVRLAEREEGDEGALQVELKSQWQTVAVSEDLSSTTVSLGARGEIGTRMELLEAGA